MPKWLLGSVDRRRSSRLRVDGLMAAYWRGTAADPRPVREISMHGAAVDAPDEWYAGTLLRLALTKHENGSAQARPGASCAVWGRVVRRAGGGVCFEFVFPSEEERRELRSFLAVVKRRQSAQPAAAGEKSEG